MKGYHDKTQRCVNSLVLTNPFENSKYYQLLLKVHFQGLLLYVTKNKSLAAISLRMLLRNVKGTVFTAGL